MEVSKKTRTKLFLILNIILALLGWDTWTEWSICDENHEQHRKRNCRSSNPGPNMCQGPNVETRICKIGKC